MKTHIIYFKLTECNLIWYKNETQIKSIKIQSNKKLLSYFSILSFNTQLLSLSAHADNSLIFAVFDKKNKSNGRDGGLTL